MSPVLPAPDVVVRAARPDDHAAGLVFEAAPEAYTAVAGSESRARAAIEQLWRMPGHSASFEHALVAELDGRLVGVMIGFPARDRYRLHVALLLDGTTFHRVGFALAAGGVGNRFFDKYYEHRNPGRGTIARVIARAVGGYAVSRAMPRRDNRSRYAGRLFAPTHARVVIDGEEQPLSPVIDGERFTGIVRIVVRAGPRIRIAQP
jgi:hypothetical protein